MGTTNMDRKRGIGLAYWIRRRSDGESPPLVRASSMSNGVVDDPLVYRLLHQKELSTRRKQTDVLRRKNVDGMSESDVIDPFDLWGSFTSEESSCKFPFHDLDDGDGGDDSDECITSRVDVQGWETRNHGSKSSDQTCIQQSPPFTRQSSSSSTSSQRPKPLQEEEEDPRINQLKKQSTKELREELINMQHRAKCNLEETWEVAERSRVENSSLDDRLEDIKRKLHAGILSVGYVRQISAHAGDQQRVESEDSFNGGSDFIEKRLSSSSRNLQPQSNFCENHSKSAPRTLCDKNGDGEGFNGARNCSGRFIRRFGSISELGRNVKSCTSVDSDSHGTIEIDEELFNSLLSQDMATSLCNSFNDSSCDTLDEGCDAINGVYYPALDINSLARQTLAGSSIGDDPSREQAVDAAERIVLDDFDFDPLHTLSETDQRKTVNEKPKKGRGGPVQRRTLMSLFGDRNDDVHVGDSVTASLRGQIKENATTVTKALVFERENDIEQMTTLVQTQKEDILAYEKLIAGSCDKCDENEKQSLEKQSKIQREVDALRLLYAEMELRLNRHEISLQRAEKHESSLKQLIVTIDQMRQENRRELNLEAYLSWCQHQYKASQEIAIGTLSTLLEDVNGMCIPSLREEDEGDVPGDIRARFEDLADKEEELVKVLCSPNLLLHANQHLSKLKNVSEIY